MAMGGVSNIHMCNSILSRTESRFQVLANSDNKYNVNIIKEKVDLCRKL